jgi:hypothetical protein
MVENFRRCQKKAYGCGEPRGCSYVQVSKAKRKFLKIFYFYFNFNRKNGAGGGGGGGGGPNDESGKFKDALKEAIVTENPNVKWTDIAGLENAKKALQEAVILPIKYPEIFTGARKPWKGILLYGVRIFSKISLFCLKLFFYSIFSFSIHLNKSFSNSLLEQEKPIWPRLAPLNVKPHSSLYPLPISYQNMLESLRSMILKKFFFFFFYSI